MSEETVILTQLDQFTGTENYYQVPFTQVNFTDGIKVLCELCQCYWLISDLGIEYQHNKKLQKPFLIVQIRVNEDKSCIVTLREDTNLDPVYRKKYNFTDFPLKEYEFYLIENVFLLKSEY